MLLASLLLPATPLLLASLMSMAFLLILASLLLLVSLFLQAFLLLMTSPILKSSLLSSNVVYVHTVAGVPTVVGNIVDEPTVAGGVPFCLRPVMLLFYC
jgi:hypothetical protein